jgi:hypothetical protein
VPPVPSDDGLCSRFRTVANLAVRHLVAERRGVPRSATARLSVSARTIPRASPEARARAAQQPLKLPAAGFSCARAGLHRGVIARAAAALRPWLTAGAKVTPRVSEPAEFSRCNHCGLLRCGQHRHPSTRFDPNQPRSSCFTYIRGARGRSACR